MATTTTSPISFSEALRIDPLTPADHQLLARAGSDTLAIYLSAQGVGRGAFNWLRLGEGQPTHALFLSDRRNHWYLDGVAGLGSDLAATVAWIRGTADTLGVKKIRLVGSSMGAFGALLLGQHLGALPWRSAPRSCWTDPAAEALGFVAAARRSLPPRRPAR